MSQLDEYVNRISKSINTGNYRKSAKLLSNLAMNIDNNQIDLTVDLISRALKSRLGPKFSRAFISLSHKKVEQYKIYQIEKSLINTHILIDGEGLIDSFIGSLESDIEKVNGRIFLTNFRIIATGYQRDLPKTGVVKQRLPSRSILRTIVNTAKTAQEIKQSYDPAKKIKKSMNRGFFSVNRIQYGSYYPLSPPETIMVKDQSLEFIISVSYLSDEERIFGELEVKITRERFPFETQEDFQKNKILSYNLFKNALKDSYKEVDKLQVVNMGNVSDFAPFLGTFFKENEGKAWTVKAILNRKDQLDLPNNLRYQLSEKIIADTLEQLFSEGLISRNIHEGNFFYFL
jgi:hypothetical protein